MQSTEEPLPEHTRLSASGAERWMECPASIQIAELFGLEGEESTFAAEGTAAHELAAFCLEDGSDAWEHIGETFYEHVVDDDMSTAVQVYLDYCRDLIARKRNQNPEIMIETRVDRKSLHPDFGGTADFILRTETDIYVVDYKHGVGIAKDAKDNPQLMYYALGAFYQIGVKAGCKIKDVYYVIVQPRAFHPLGTIRDAKMRRGDLIEWGNTKLLPAMRDVDEIAPRIKPGEHCVFCPAKIGCPAMAAMYDAAANANAADAALLSDKELGLEYERINQVKKYTDAIQKEAYARAMKGKKIPGGKLIEGRVDRVLSDDGKKEAVKVFGDDAYAERKLLSPTQIEKTCVGGPRFVSQYAHKPKKGKLSFVPTSHKSPAIVVKTAAEKFEGIKKG